MNEDITALTPPQHRLVELLATGYSLTEAAKRQRIAYGTAKNYVLAARRAVSAQPVTTARLVALWVHHYWLPVP